MQIKAYRLAAELRVSEARLLRWLHERGYAEAKSHDWLSGQLAQAARRALVHAAPQLMGQAPVERSLMVSEVSATSRGAYAHVRAEVSSHAPPQGSHQGSHQGSSAPSTSPLHTTHAHDPAALLHQLKDLAHPPAQPLSTAPLSAHLKGGSSLTAADQTLEGLSAEVARLRWSLSEQQRMMELQLQALRAQHEKASQERSLYRQRVIELEGQQATISQAYEELTEAHEARAQELEELKTERARLLEHTHVQREAWQARAQELEDQVQSGRKLPHQLRELGLEAFEDQVKLFQSLLSTPESAGRFFQLIKMVDRDGVQRLVEERVVPTCAHPLCNQTNALRHKLSLRVDRPKRCKVCEGELDRRWFQRMLASCERANVRRLLMVGGEEAHPRLRALMEGESLSCRFINSTEQSGLARIQQRLGSSDLLITWPHASSNPTMIEAYRAEAAQMGNLTVELLCESADLSKLSRAVLNLVQRTAGG